MNRASISAATGFSLGLLVMGGIVAGGGREWFQAVAAPEMQNCARPAYLVVSIDNLNRDKSRAYGEALRRTQIVASYGGSYKISGSPAVVLEGEWPKGRSYVVEQYPCLDAIKQFWASDQYQKEIKPLREGSGDYNVVAFEEYRPAGK